MNPSSVFPGVSEKDYDVEWYTKISLNVPRQDVGTKVSQLVLSAEVPEFYAKDIVDSLKYFAGKQDLGWRVVKWCGENYTVEKKHVIAGRPTAQIDHSTVVRLCQR